TDGTGHQQRDRSLQPGDRRNRSRSPAAKNRGSCQGKIPQPPDRLPDLRLRARHRQPGHHRMEVAAAIRLRGSNATSSRSLGTGQRGRVCCAVRVLPYMKVLVLNSGSSSQKACLYEIGATLPTHPPTSEWEGRIEWNGDTASIAVKNSKGIVLKEQRKLS